MKVVILHFRSAPRSGIKGNQQHASLRASDSAGTDGVSLEMKKRTALLEEMGHEVAICSAYGWADFPIPDLEFDCEEVEKMVRNLFGTTIADYGTEAELKKVFDASVLKMKKELSNVLKEFQADTLFVHNVLCLPIHPVATVSLTELVRESNIPCTAIHHDILSEGAYKFTPTCDLARSLLEEYYPPTMPNMKHWTINTRNKKALAKKGVNAGLIHDSMDFDTGLDPKEHARVRSNLRAKYGLGPADIVFLAAARIVPNKQTEIAGHLIAALERLRHDIVGKKLYHGKTFSETSRFVLVLAGRPERAFLKYRDNLFHLLDSLKIDWMYVGNDVGPERSEDGKVYSLYPDAYALADFVMYPTGWEGFGNQLLEAFAAGVPVAVFEYPVFKEDIGPRGVRVVSLGNTLLEEKDSADLVQISGQALDRAADEIKAILTASDTFQDIVEQNITVGKKHFSFDVLRAHLQESVQWAAGL